jgi:hypothetical protein
VDFIVSSFKDACAIEAFHGKWMLAEIWAQNPVKHFKLNKSLRFNGNDLVKALGLKSYASLNSEMLVADHRNMTCFVSIKRIGSIAFIMGTKVVHQKCHKGHGLKPPP